MPPHRSRASGTLRGTLLFVLEVAPDRPEHLGASPHGRPRRPIRSRALGRQRHHPLHGRNRRAGPPHPGVHRHHHFALPALPQRPLGREALLAAAVALYRASAGDELDEEDAEGVDVAAVGEVVRVQLLRVNVPGRALHHCRNVGCFRVVHG